MIEEFISMFLVQENIIAAISLFVAVYIAKKYNDLQKHYIDDLKEITKLQEENMKEIASVLSKITTLVEVIKDVVMKRKDR